MATSPDLDAAKDRLVDSLSIAREATLTAVRDDIAPAVVAAVEAAREASAPVLAEAASRTGDAVSALRGSDAVARGTDAVKAMANSDAVKAVATSDAVAKVLNKPKKRSKKVPFLLGLVGAGGAAFAVMKRRKPAPTPHYPTAVPPTTAPTDPDTSDPT